MILVMVLSDLCQGKCRTIEIKYA